MAQKGTHDTYDSKNLYENIQDDLTSKKSLLPQILSHKTRAKDCVFNDIPGQPEIEPNAPIYETSGSMIEPHQTAKNCGALLPKDPSAKQKIPAGNVQPDIKIRAKSQTNRRPKTLTKSRRVYVVRRSKTKVAAKNRRQSSVSRSAIVSNPDSGNYLNTMTLFEFLVANKNSACVILLGNSLFFIAMQVAKWLKSISEDWWMFSNWFLIYVSVLSFAPTLIYFTDSKTCTAADQH